MDNKFKNELYNTILELDYALTNKDAKNSNIDISATLEYIIGATEYLLETNNNSFAEAFNLEDEYGDNPGVDLVREAYDELKDLYFNMYM